LSNRDQVAALFAALGYQIDSRLTHSSANLGITSEPLVRQVTHLERLADQEGLRSTRCCSVVTACSTMVLGASAEGWKTCYERNPAVGN
jgi:hypothetical protein